MSDSFTIDRTVTFASGHWGSLNLDFKSTRSLHLLSVDSG